MVISWYFYLFLNLWVIWYCNFELYIVYISKIGNKITNFKKLHNFKITQKKEIVRITCHLYYYFFGTQGLVFVGRHCTIWATPQPNNLNEILFKSYGYRFLNHHEFYWFITIVLNKIFWDHIKWGTRYWVRSQIDLTLV
jgi:hypothetical protein